MPSKHLGEISDLHRNLAPGGLKRPPAAAVVKWYNPDMVSACTACRWVRRCLPACECGSSAAATIACPPGATLEVRAGPGSKGPQVTEILSVDSSTAQQESPRRGRPGRPKYRPTDQAAIEDFGPVKWLQRHQRVLAFIASDRGGKDIFGARLALNRAGIADLAAGERVAVDVIDGRNGPEAAGLRLL
jgi:cold shock protein